ncbi:adenylate/guanylate cyclase domain-containing protein [Actinomycetospora soli]|uniref:adenylate/guanylate cyclase domain-containing protein n=1 Tax=Actinomycetospora soli TaxID=2893887 RepID=UPI001E58BA88|nr:adenylate/guanylate cyclase domain-containing protein [Actinomycetospora soli]MCD2186967.1 adenylate/guanylate cyclase domain-containing protein [Actinomycetospora soli]
MARRRPRRSGPPVEARAGDRGLTAGLRALLLLVVVLPNVIGAGVVLVLAAWVLPHDLVDAPALLLRNLVVFAGYVVLAVAVGAGWGHLLMRVRPLRVDADERQRRGWERRFRKVVLGGPVRLAAVQTTLWGVASAVFLLLNVFDSWRIALQVAATVLLGGLATVSITYRLVEVVLRPAARRVLAARPPSGTVLPGVLMRTLGGWVFGTAVPLLGVVLAAVAALALGTYDVTRLAVVVVVLGGVALVLGGAVITLTALSTAAPVLAVRRALKKVERGDYDVDVPVFDTTELGLLQAGFNTMVSGLRERERVRDLFGRQVGEDVARHAMDNDVELGGEVREVAVLFVDLVGSTTLAATRPPQEVVELLNEFFAVVIDVVEDHGGWINKFEGDAALAVFGAPTELPDAAGRALAAGRVMAARLAEEVFPATTELGAGIGVSAGEAVAGNIGDRRRYEYTVIGDPVNEAARLCDLAKDVDGGVVGSGAALERAGDETDRWTTIGSRTLRGRTTETTIHAPTRLAGRATQPSSNGDPTPAHEPA